MNETSRASTAGGMLDAPIWTELRIAKLALPKPLCAQMLYFVAKYLAPKVLFRQTIENVMQKAQNMNMEESLPSAFPGKGSRLAAMQYLLGENIDLPKEDPDFGDLNDEIKKARACKKCNTDDKPITFEYSISICLAEKLGELAADLLSLTLFATEDQSHHFPMLSYVPWLKSKTVREGIDVISGVVGRAQTWEELIVHGWRPVMMQELQILSCNSHAIFEHVLDLIGQPFDSETVLSSTNGQVIYPSILERGPLHGSAYLQLRCTSGCLIWDGSTLGALVSGPNNCRTASRPTPSATSVEYSPTRRRLQKEPFSLILHELQRKESLYSFTTVVLIPIGQPGTYFYRQFNVNVWDLIDGIGQAVLSPDCGHRQDSPAGPFGEHFLLLENDFQFESFELGDQSLLINHDGNLMFQMLRLAVSRECCVLY